MAVAEKVRQFTSSPISRMTTLSDEYGAIDLSQGMPDFDPPSQLIEAAVNAIRHGSNQYATSCGQAELREGIARKLKEYNRIEANPEKDITVTCGATEAITAAVLALTNPGEGVVVTEPFFESYVPAAILAGSHATYVPFVGRHLTLDEENLKDAMEKRPKLIILNTPNNPTGKMLDSEQLKLIADLCEEQEVIAIVDEIYEHITYDGKKHVSLATVGNMHERTVTVSGASKTYSVTGWRVGWAIAEARLSDAVRKVHDYITGGAPRPFQEGLITAVNFPRSYYERLADMYDKKRRRLMKALDEVGIEYHRPEGAYFILMNAPDTFRNGEDFTDHLLREARIAALPAKALYHDKNLGERKVRLAFCKKDVTLQEAARRLKKWILRPKPKLTTKARP